MYRLFIAVTGDIPVETISHPHARDFKAALLNLPANMKKSPLYRNKSVQQILSMKIEKTLAIATVNKHSNLFYRGFPAISEQRHRHDRLVDMRHAHPAFVGDEF